MKNWKKYLILFSIDLGLIVTWIIVDKPDQSESIVAIFIIPALFIINLIIAIVFSFIDSYKAKIFFINSIIAPLLFFLLFILWYKLEGFVNYKEYQIRYKNVNYELTILKKVNRYSIQEMKSGYSTGLLDSTYKVSNDSIFLYSDSMKIFVFRDTIFGFPKDGDKIRLNKIK